jgi:hypothetical protein
VNTEIKIDVGLASVSDDALAMLEGPGGVASLPAGLCSKLLDALADELWHSLRMLENWLSNSDEASHGDPDLEAASEVIARVWMAMRGALGLIADGPVDESLREFRN